MRSDCVCAFNTADFTDVDKEGKIIYPFNGAAQKVSRVCLALNA